MAVQRGGRVEGLRRRVYRLTVGRGKGALVCRSVDDSVTIGSHPGNGLVVADPTVSRFHARIELDARGFLLSDLDSTNGTWVGGMRVRSVYLPPKAKLQLGDVEVLFEVQKEAQDLPLSTSDRFGALVGQSAAMRRLYQELQQVADSDVTVLLSGETGTGKDLAASEIHRHSARRERPFVVVDCGGLPDSLIDAELFGHERGAFTGADSTRAGAFEEADGGTIFLDEVAELSPAVQSKLLRAIEARTVKRLGGNDWRKVDVRVIAATHQDLARMCNQRLFREDLYFRLAVVKLRLPPLRERPDDLPLLVQGALDEIGGASLELDERLLAALRARHWAGNVRELRNVVQRAVVLGPAALGDENVEARALGGEEPYKVAKARAVEEFERRFIIGIVERASGNVTKAARAADVDAAWLFRLIKRYQIDVASLRGGARPPPVPKAR
ncbi:MAG: sigma54 specific transcriptional regulator, Fis family [Myxococcales bacterium]|nr:sigma54 specific transcriptional regulator, Fis family [Myxococcales bacterium]